MRSLTAIVCKQNFPHHFPYCMHCSHESQSQRNFFHPTNCITALSAIDFTRFRIRCDVTRACITIKPHVKTYHRFQLTASTAHDTQTEEKKAYRSNLLNTLKCCTFQMCLSKSKTNKQTVTAFSIDI